MKKTLQLFFCFLCFGTIYGNQATKKAIIFGVSGQDGSYLSELLLEKNYEVHGVVRRSSSPNTSRIDHIINNPRYVGQFHIHYGDLTDGGSMAKLFEEVIPDEIYNLAAQSDVKVSFDIPEYTAQADAIGTLNILEAIRSAHLTKKTKFYQASTSELYGLVREIPQKETTPFYPRSPYATSKLFAYWSTVNYREAYGIFASNGILFNHESPRRGENFVTRKVTIGACKYKLGLQDVLYLGNLDSMRDWGYAKDYVEAIWEILQLENPDDFVIATGENHSVREFVELAYKNLGVEIEWKGEGVNEYGIDKATGNAIVKIDPALYRPSEVEFLLGNPEKAKTVLHWSPKTSFFELVRLMIEADYQSLSKQKCI